MGLVSQSFSAKIITGSWCEGWEQGGDAEEPAPSRQMEEEPSSIRLRASSGEEEVLEMASGASQGGFGGWDQADRRPYPRGSGGLGEVKGEKPALSSARQINVREGSVFWLLLSPSAPLCQARVLQGHLDCGKLQMV